MINNASSRGAGIRKLTLKDLLPDCRIEINRPVYDLRTICRAKDVVDVGCGHGWTRRIVEDVGGRWIGVEPFEDGGQTVTARAELLPLRDDSVDVVIMSAVLEHLEEVDGSIAEAARILRPGGLFVGYAAFMECFHEISFHHLSFRALEHLAAKHGLTLTAVGGGSAFGIDYHLAVLLHPIPTGRLRKIIASSIRAFIGIKAAAATVYLMAARRVCGPDARRMGRDFYVLECLRQSTGFDFVMEKVAAAGAAQEA